MQGVRLYRVEALRAIEARAAAQLPPRTLMQRAGLAAAEFVARRYANARRVLIVCGPGNNGGDGYELAAHLKAAGRDVRCAALAPPAAEDARGARALWDAAGGVTLTALPAGETFDLLVDAIFGIGVARPFGGMYLAATEWLALQTAPVLALDIPSGLDADTGAWVGGVAGVDADATITFIAAKPGLFTHAGCDASGVVEVADLGVEAIPAEPSFPRKRDSGTAVQTDWTPASAETTGTAGSQGWLNGPEHFGAVATKRRRDTHKGSFGDVAVVGGGVGMAGAPLLAARAALRLGAGRVYVDSIGALEVKLDPQQPELMFRSAASLQAADAWVVGCGLGVGLSAHNALTAVLARGGKVVIDADALNIVAAEPALLAGQHATRVLTPHPLEAARLLGGEATSVQANRIDAARALAQRFAALVVLKGAGSVVAEPAGRYWINPTGTPALATPGTGDVLAGMIGALLAQSFEPLHAVLAAVWLHGAAADRFGADVGLVAGDVPALAAESLSALRRTP